MLDDHAARGRGLAHWKHHVNRSWPDVKVVDLDVDTAAAHEGDERVVRARVELGALNDGEVTVQALHGPIDSAGSFIATPATVTPVPRATAPSRAHTWWARPVRMESRCAPFHIIAT